MEKKLTFINNNQAFTLIEVMISLAIFGVFVTAFVTSQGYNVADSANFRRENQLKNLAEMKLAELILDPPDFTPALELKKEKKKFKDYSDYQYTITFKKFFVPNMASLQEDNDKDSGNSQVQQKIFATVKENLEKLVWQVQIEIQHLETEEVFSVSTWLYNHKAEVNVQTF